MDGARAQVSRHEHSERSPQGAPSSEATGIGSLGCHCSGIGCVSSGPGIASLTTIAFFEMAPAVFDFHEDPSGLRVGHGLDLIRPPSTF